MENYSDQTIDNLKDRINKFKDEFQKSIGLNKIKVKQLEKELEELNSDISSNKEQKPGEDIHDISRLYRAEKSFSTFLQTKIIGLETETNNSNPITSKDSQNIIDIMKSEFVKLTNILTSNNSEIQVAPVQEFRDDHSTGSIDGILAQEQKKTKDMLKQQKEFYDSKLESLKLDLKHKTLETQALKTTIHENEEQREDISQDEPLDGVPDLEEEFELTKSALETLRFEHQSIERELNAEQLQIDHYRKELTDLKRILGDKNKEIKSLKASVDEKEKPLSETEIEFAQETLKTVEKLEQEKSELKSEFELSQRELNIQKSNNRSLEAKVKQHEKEIAEFRSETVLIKTQQELDTIIKSLWKIEANIGIFEKKNTEIDVFERHLEVYSVLLGKVFKTKTHAIVLDSLFKNKGNIINKKMIIEDTKLEPFLAIRILRELSDLELISLNEEENRIEMMI